MIPITKYPQDLPLKNSEMVSTNIQISDWSVVFTIRTKLDNKVLHDLKHAIDEVLQYHNR